MNMAFAARLLVGLLAVASGGDAPSGRGTAHEPRFQDKTLWPKLTGKEHFLKETWPKGRVMAWAHPGTNGGKRVRGLDLEDPKNWLVDGKPCGKVVFDANTDILLPASDTYYTVNPRSDRLPQVYRHITVERNACFGGGGDGIGRSIFGNVWVRKGAGMDAQGATRFLGDGHTFFRNDNTLQTARDTGRGGGIMSSQYFVFNKDANASVEFLGHVSVLDEFRIHGCLVIVGPDSRVQPGRNASPTIDRGGILALLDGATFESWNNDFGSPEMVVRDGTIQGGLPERPLTRSCTFGLAFKNHAKASYADADEKLKQRTLVRVPGLVVLSGHLRSYSRDVKRARLVFGVMDDQEICPEPGSERYEKEIGRSPEKKQLFAWMRKLPRGTDCYLAKDVTVDGVEFDHLRKGGLLCEDPAARANWKNVFFGPHCAAKEPDLLTHLTAPLNRNQQY